MATLASVNEDFGSEPKNGNSFGPFVAITEDQFAFDARVREAPIWLGHLATPLFGTLQFMETWTEESSDELMRLKQSYRNLLNLTREGLCGKLKLKPLESQSNSTTLISADLIYQYISVSVLDQYSDSHKTIAKSIEEHVSELSIEFDSIVVGAISDGPNFEFEFQFSDASMASRFRKTTRQAGILVNDGKSNDSSSGRVSFQLNFAFRDARLQLFWERLRLAFDICQHDAATVSQVSISPVPDNATQLSFHHALMLAKTNRRDPNEFQAKEYLKGELEKRNQDLRVEIVDASNFADYRQRILDMQIAIYEPVRRTPAEEFDMLFASENPLAILVLDGEKIAAMVFAGRLALFQLERGVSTDPYLDDPTVYYSMDLTVSPRFRGGVGRLMKQALVMLAIDKGVTAIHGRNRDRLAAGMWAINLSLGSYELQRLKDDYPDQQEFRDCIYYRCPLVWQCNASEQTALARIDRAEFGKILDRTE